MAILENHELHRKLCWHLERSCLSDIIEFCERCENIGVAIDYSASIEYACISRLEDSGEHNSLFYILQYFFSKGAHVERFIYQYHHKYLGSEATILYGPFAVIELMVEHGADVYLYYPDSFALAILYGHQDVIDYYLSKKFNIGLLENYPSEDVQNWLYYRKLYNRLEQELNKNLSNENNNDKTKI